MAGDKAKEVVLVLGDGETWEIINENMEIGIIEYDADLAEDDFFPFDDVTSAIRWKEDSEGTTYKQELTGKDILNWVYGAIFSKNSIKNAEISE